MPQTLCIDFGTSSIRAAVRDRFSDISVLDIGRVTNSETIDSASIRSEVCIDADLQTVRFGERAYEAIINNKKIAFHNASPKLWLKEPHLLDDRVIPELDLSRRDLITGLLAYALYAAAETGNWEAPVKPDAEDIRIAHPVWPDQIKSSADRALRQIAWVATSMATEGDWGIVDIDILKSWTSPQTPEEGLPELVEKFDTLEPVAAAVELLPGISNRRMLCAVVDVGAGTTDIGIFQSIIPDSNSKIASRLIPTGPTLSVFKAGNDIDTALLKLMAERYPNEFKKNENDLKLRIRGLKENLFTQGKLRVEGIEISLQDLEETSEIQLMIKEIRQSFELAFQNAGSGIRTWLSSKEGIESQITLAMAGGGAEISFLVSALSKKIKLEGYEHPLHLLKTEPRIIYDLKGAGYSRMVVSLGGVSELYESVIHEHSKLLGIPSLGRAKQIIKSW
jgi:hypothetical protein